MILQALNEYYERKAADATSGTAPEGFGWEDIPFVIVIDKDGSFVTLEDTRTIDGKRKKAKAFLVPKAVQRSGIASFEHTNLLWDHVGYVLGHAKSNSEKDLKLAKKQHVTWLLSLENLPPRITALPVIAAIRGFYDTGQCKAVLASPSWTDAAKIAGCKVAFRLDGDAHLAPCEPVVHDVVKSTQRSKSDKSNDSELQQLGVCLITGERAPIARTHTKTPINKDANTLVGFQRSSGYDSYGKEQAFNAPVSVRAEFRYTEALNILLSSERNRLRVGDATTVFWADRSTPLEEIFPSFFSSARIDDPDEAVHAVKALYDSIHTGARTSSYTDARFFVLGLATGGGSRICVRFWHQSTAEAAATRILQHFEDLEIAVDPSDAGDAALATMLASLGSKGDEKNCPPRLYGEMVRAILSGGPYPATIVPQALRRIRGDRNPHRRGSKKYWRTERIRPALLKAALNRFQRVHPSSEKEITVALDETNNNTGYRLGRLFAVLEKIQEEAHPGINATIRDRYYGAASANPVTVFPQLLKLKNHHLAKLENPGFKSMHEKRLGEIIGGIPPEMPAHLRMEDQARFAIGYYHQRQALFTKATSSES